jgi:hypothetical protein
MSERFEDCAACSAYLQQSQGWRNAASWDELSEETRQHWRDWVNHREVYLNSRNNESR